MWGRKRWVAVDSAGLIHAAAVRAADMPEGEGGRALLRQAVELGRLQRVATVWMDGGYAGGFEAWVREPLGWQMEVVLRRWIVERTFAWLGWYQRLSEDDAFVLERRVRWIDLAMVHIVVRRLELRLEQMFNCKTRSQLVHRLPIFA
ncbi:MAG: hypothetical protein NZ693_09230 [Thermoflexales bacterium]|nr:hypothetical protein [Thermoflexales bacterium]